MINRYILFFSFLVFSIGINAQELVFSKSAGSDTIDSDLDQGHAIAIDESGNSYITGIMSNWNTGSIFGAGEANQTILPLNGAFIAKYATNGALLWARAIDTNNNELSSNAISLDAVNNVYITGYFSATITFGQGTASQTSLNSNGGRDVFFAKYSADGDFLWAKTFGGNVDDAPGGQGIIIDDNQNIYLTGAINDVVVFGAGEPNETTITANNLDIFLAKYDQNANLIWVKHAGGPDNDGAKDLDLDSSGNIYITGNFFGSASFAQSLPGQVNLTGLNEAAFIAKYDSNGQLIWAQSPYLQVGTNIGNAIKVLSDDRIVFTGGFYALAVLTDCVNVTATSEDMILIQFDADGNYIWNTVINSGMDDRGVGLAVDASNHIFVTGYFGADVILNDGQCREVSLANNGSGDLFIVTYDINGQLLTATSAGSSNWDQASGIAVNDSGDIYITGFYENNIIFGPSEINETSLVKNGPKEIFIAKYNLDLSIGNDIPYAGEHNCIELCEGMAPIDLFDNLLQDPDSGGSWSPSLTSGTGIFDPNIDIEGVYRYEILDGTCISDFAEITVSLNPQGDPGENNTLSLCLTDSAIDLFNVLGGNPDTGGAWTPSLNSGTSLFDPSIDSAGIYTYTITSPDCDPLSAEIDLSIITTVNAGISNVLDICQTDGSINLFDVLGGNPDSGGVWSPSLISGTGVFDPSSDNSGIYTYTVSSTSCGSENSTIDINIDVLPNPGTNSILDICQSDAAINLLDVLGGNPDSGGVWSPALNSGTGVFDPSSDNSGIYTYTVSSANCGSEIATIEINIDVLPNPGTNSNLDMCQSDAAINLFDVLGGNPDSGGVWSPALSSGTGLFNPSLDATGNYSYTVTDNCGSQSAEVTVKNKPNCEAFPDLSYPKYFTPNGDGYHDYWQIRGIENYNTSQIFIFDRFGKLLKQLSPLNQGWNGRYRGQLLPATDYWFSVKLDDGATFSGHFALRL